MDQEQALEKAKSIFGEDQVMYVHEESSKPIEKASNDGFWIVTKNKGSYRGQGSWERVFEIIDKELAK